MRESNVWLVKGVISERTDTDVHIVADTFEEAAQLGPEALLSHWPVANRPDLQVTSIELVHEGVLLGE